MHYRPFKSVLIANRGEIARRICKESWDAGVEPHLAFSDVEAEDESFFAFESRVIHIRSPDDKSPFLSIKTIIDAALDNDIEAIHPGYGFLSENPEFAQAVIDAGLVWIGPSPSAIRAMGDKGNAKDLARKAGLPVIPGYDGDDQSDETLLAEARKIGWPVLIKAALGGGGRGQRKVAEESAFIDALASARREALSSFASDRIILEKALAGVRHIEVQIFGDSHGNLIHLGERDCSAQRRNQKIIEEAPAVGINEELRSRMGSAAIALARSVEYTNAGTVEFLLDNSGSFYFMEMNTRIQVEHPVTEEVTGTNLIRMQFDIAEGLPLSIKQQDIHFSGHAVEARLCAEDAANNFAPQTGRFRYPNPFGGASGVLRVDRGFSLVTSDYDSMTAKLIAHGKTREEAIKKLAKGLRASKVLGLKTNRDYLLAVLESEPFRAGTVTTSYLSDFHFKPADPLEGTLGACAAIMTSDETGSSWSSTGAKREFVTLRHGNNRKNYAVHNGTIGTIQRLQDVHLTKRHTGDEIGSIPMRIDGKLTWLQFLKRDGKLFLEHAGEEAIFEDITYAPAERKDSAGAGAVRAPMAGKIIKLATAPGATVVKGDLLVILEAMKMEHELRAATDGIIDTISIKPGDQVAMRQLLVTVKPV
jgi:geranyl-CoA carboxylase alpha subunit